MCIANNILCRISIVSLCLFPVFTKLRRILTIFNFIYWYELVDCIFFVLWKPTHSSNSGIIRSEICLWLRIIKERSSIIWALMKLNLLFTSCHHTSSLIDSPHSFSLKAISLRLDIFAFYSFLHFLIRIINERVVIVVFWLLMTLSLVKIFVVWAECTFFNGLLRRRMFSLVCY